MQVKRLEKLQKHLETLHLFKTRARDKWGSTGIELPKTKQDNTRFSINDWEFDCGMPACVAGHAKFVFNWKGFESMWEIKFRTFFDLTHAQTNWIVEMESYESLNPTPKTASKHIQDVLDGEI